MFQRLQKKWKVNGRDLALILITFALTGTTTAWITRQITSWLGVTSGSAEWIILKLFVLLIGYQLLILFFGFIFGQFSFFWNYEKKILKRIGFFKNEGSSPIKLAVFASGTGSNFKKIAEYFNDNKRIGVSLLVCDRADAGALNIAAEKGIPVFMATPWKSEIIPSLKDALTKHRIDYIILAGFLRKIPAALIEQFPERIVNIHPALLPEFGGKGMYGNKVHEAVIRSAVDRSGITIHFVDENYDEGDVIFQKECPIEKGETPESLAKKIHLLEYEHYAPQIEALIQMQNPG